jgi:hypothetical protein
MSNDRQAPLDYLLIISLLALLVFLTQYTFRYLDDNRLTSWQWAFTDVYIARVSIFLVIGLFIAYLLSISSLFERRPVLSLFFTSYIVSLFLISEPEVIVDVSRYFTQAKYLELYGVGYFLKEWGRGIDAWTDMPLVPFLYGLIFRFLGESRLFIQFLTISFFSMTVILTYMIGRDLWDTDTGIYGGLFLLGMPYLLTQVPLMLVDVPTMFFLILSIFTYIKALRSGGLWIILSSVSMVSAVLSKYSTLLMLTILVVISLVFFIERKEYRQLSKSAILRRTVMVYLITGTFLVLIIVTKFDVIKTQLDILFNYQKPALKGWSEGLVSTFLYQIHPFITITAICSLYVALKKRDARYLIISWLVLIILLMQIRRIRYTLIVFPLFALMASYGLKGFGNQRLRGFFSYTAVVFSIIITFTVYLPFLQRMAPVNLGSAGDFLNSKAIEAVMVVTVPSEERILNQAVTVPLLDLYFKGDIYYQQRDIPPPPFEEFRMSPLRFTWEYRIPEYYTHKGKVKAIVIISNRKPLPLPDRLIGDFDRVVDFQKSTGFFRYSPSVRIYY